MIDDRYTNTEDESVVVTGGYDTHLYAHTQRIESVAQEEDPAVLQVVGSIHRY